MSLFTQGLAIDIDIDIDIDAAATLIRGRGGVMTDGETIVRFVMTREQKKETLETRKTRTLIRSPEP